MSNQTTDTILMVRPCAFGYNPETAVNNFFQVRPSDSDQVQKLALAEFDSMVNVLLTNNITVLVVEDTLTPHTPDSIFPNNWFSTHADGRMVLYPMYAQNRRLERRADVVELIKQHKSLKNKQYELIDLSFYEAENRFLEGTGSIIFDRTNGIAYASISERTDLGLFHELCNKLNYKAIQFTAYQTVGTKRLPIYHTNVLLCVGKKFVVMCMDSIDAESEQQLLRKTIAESNKQLVEISEEQLKAFAGNMIQLTNKSGDDLLLLSQTAFNSLSDIQIEQLSMYNKLLPLAVPTIEKLGGGSVRCMVAEIY